MLGKLRVVLMVLFSFSVTLTGFLFLPFGKAGAFYRKISPFFGMVNLWILGAKPQVEGLENLDKDKNYVFVGNHQSYADIFLLQSCLGKAGIRTLFMAKEELFKIPLFGKCIKEMGLIAVPRGESRQGLKVLMAAAEKVKNGYNIVVFAEGSRTYDGRLGEFKKGAFILADKTRLPVVPFVITGTMNVLPRDNKQAHKGPCKVSFMPVIESNIYKTKELAEIVSLKISDLYTEQKAEMDKIWNS